MKKILQKKRNLLFNCDCGCDFTSDEWFYLTKKLFKPSGYGFKTIPEREYQIEAERCPLCNEICELE